MVTISEEFLTNEQMNNCLDKEVAEPTPLPPNLDAAAAAPPPATAFTASSSDSSDEEDDDDCPPLRPEEAPNPPPPPPPQLAPEQPAQPQQHKQKGKQNKALTQNAQQKTRQPQRSPKDLPARTPEGVRPAAPHPEPAKPQSQPQPQPQPQPAPQAPRDPQPAPTPQAAPPLQPPQVLPAVPVVPGTDGTCRGGRGPAPAPAPAAPAFPHMEAVTRVLSLPVVESGVSMVTGVYSRVKNSNPVAQWGLDATEGSVKSALGRSMSLLEPLGDRLSGPLSVLDALLCRGLDMVEYKVPLITLPPEVMVSASRDYMTMRVVAPMLRMTATNARLADALAARALDSADHYVDRFLPGDAATENGDAVGAGAGSSKAGAGGAALQRVDRISRKLQRRITRRTLAEARALRKHSEDTLHTLLYFAETLIRDPKAFVEQCHAVWTHLSENEPENQVPPETLEERLALLVREVARRVVHLANFTAANASPAAVSNIASHVLKSVRMEGARVLSYTQSQMERVHMNHLLGDLNVYTNQLLERLAHLLAGLRSSSTSSRPQPFSHTGTNNIAIVN